MLLMSELEDHTVCYRNGLKYLDVSIYGLTFNATKMKLNFKLCRSR